jgi:transposase
MTVPALARSSRAQWWPRSALGDVFSKGRDFGAWLGLVPKQISTGDRTILGSISRRSNH